MTTARDIHRNLDNAERVSDIMTTDVHYVLEDANVSQVLSIMAQEQVGYVPVMNEKELLMGLVTRSSLVNVLGQRL